MFCFLVWFARSCLRLGGGPGDEILPSPTTRNDLHDAHETETYSERWTEGLFFFFFTAVALSSTDTQVTNIKDNTELHVTQKEIAIFLITTMADWTEQVRSPSPYLYPYPYPYPYLYPYPYANPYPYAYAYAYPFFIFSDKFRLIFQWFAWQDIMSNNWDAMMQLEKSDGIARMPVVFIHTYSQFVIVFYCVLFCYFSFIWRGFLHPCISFSFLCFFVLLF
jgi:hypothetical protein